MNTIKIFIINLERSLDRRKFMERQLQKTNLNYQFIRAVDSKNLDTSEILQINENRLHQQELLPQEIATTYSHAKACQALAASNECEFGLILEDDVILPSSLPQLLKSLSTELNRDGVMMLAAYLASKTSIRHIKSIDKNFDIASPLTTTGVYGTQAYLLSKSQAFSFAKKMLPVKTVADDWKYYLREGIFDEIMWVYPFPCRHAEFISLIREDSRTDISYLRKLSKKIIFKYRIFPIYHFVIRKNRKATLAAEQSFVDYLQN